MGDNTKEPGWPVSLEPTHHRTIVGAVSATGFEFVVEGLIEQGLLKGVILRSGGASVSLKFEGWSRYQELRRGAPSGRVAFMAMWSLTA